MSTYAIEHALITGVTDRPSSDALYVEILAFDDVSGRATVKTYNDTIVDVAVAPGLILSVGQIAMLVSPWAQQGLGQIVQGAASTRPTVSQNLVVPLDEG